MADKFSYLYEDPSKPADVVGNTPYGTYDNDTTFQSESFQACKFVARRLGHPIMQLEFNTGSLYATFEEAVSEYSTQINHYNMKNWMWESYGSENRVSGSGYSADGTDTMGTGSLEAQSPHMGTTFFLSDQYGEAVNVGGGLNLYSGSIALSASNQMYDLETDATLEKSGRRLEIQRIFNYGPAAITRFYDPFAGSFEQRQMLDAFGFGNVAPAVSFIMRPISYDIARAQAIETNDRIRKSAYSFELVNNKLRIFPIPNQEGQLFIQYIQVNDRNAPTG